MFRALHSSIVLLFVSTLSLSSCTRAVVTESGMRPKKPSYILSKTEWTALDTNKIDLNSIYANDGGYYFRFFGDGTCIYGNLTHSHQSAFETANDLKTGTCGYYRLEGNNLSIELFYGTQGYFYLLLEGELRPENSIVFNTKKYSAKTLGLYRQEFKLNHFDGSYRRIAAEDLPGNNEQKKYLEGNTVDWGP